MTVMRSDRCRRRSPIRRSQVRRFREEVELVITSHYWRSLRKSELGDSLSSISVEPEWLLTKNTDSRSDAVFNDIDLELKGEGYDHPIEPRVIENCMVINRDPWGVPTVGGASRRPKSLLHTGDEHARNRRRAAGRE